MKTTLHHHFANRPEAQEARELISACVHCGFCNATCPTYQELGDERDGPRGRIYLIRRMLEEGDVSSRTRVHLDRCLTCRACETTCPSGVQYGRLVDIGRGLVEAEENTRAVFSRTVRNILRRIVPHPARFGAFLRLGQTMRGLLPSPLKKKVPAKQSALPWPKTQHRRRMLVLRGCVQASATPRTNAAAADVLDRLGITLLEAPRAGCCGAASHHLSAHEEARDMARNNIDAWWPEIEAGAEAIVMTASGCGSMVKEYGYLLRHDPVYAERAKRVSDMTKDISEVLLVEDLSSLPKLTIGSKLAVHCPCSLQHGQQQPDAIDRIMLALGANLAETREKHLCCGSAGTYSILQPEMSQRLQKRKIAALTGDAPDRIVTGNVGCQLHLAARSEIPVQHWIELVHEALLASSPADENDRIQQTETA